VRLFICVILLLLSSVNIAFGVNYPEGTVIVWENGTYLNAVQRQTGSNKTHVGIILYDGVQPWVYEASRPDVHRYTFQDYVKRVDILHKQLPKLRIHFLTPFTPYHPTQIVAMKRYAHAQLGRQFGLKSYMLGRPMATLHCCEYIGNILAQTGRFRTIGPRETPKTIYEKARKL